MKNSRNLKNSRYISSLLCFPFFISKMTEEGLLQALKTEPHTCNFSFWALTSNLIQSQGCKPLFPNSLFHQNVSADTGKAPLPMPANTWVSELDCLR